jgi:hypothetical protein
MTLAMSFTSAPESAPRPLVPAADAFGPPDGAERAWVRPVLIRMGVALTRRRSYGSTHPMVVQAEQALDAALQQGLAAGATLSLGVAHRQLLVDGEPLEDGGLIAEDLAERLHRRGVGALTIQRGVTLEGVQALLGWLAQRDDADLPLPRIPAVTVGRVAYDRLALRDEASVQAEIDDVWRALASAALEDADEVRAAHGAAGRSSDGGTGGDGDGTVATSEPPESVADAIRARAGQRGYVERLGVVLGSLATRVAKAPPGVRDVIGGWLQQVIARLDASTIVTIVTSAGDQRSQRALVASVVDVLPLSAVVEWLDVASRANRQELSHHLLRLLSKLATHAGRPAGRGWSPEAFRTAARDLVVDWELGDPNPGEHAALLDHIARLNFPAVPLAPAREESGEWRAMTEAELTGNVGEAMRLVQMACELGVAGADALACVDTLMAAGRSRELLACLTHAAASEGARQLRARVLSPSGLNAALKCEPFDAEAARQLLAATDSALAPALLEALEAATSRTARRLIYDRLRSEGAVLLPLLHQHLAANPPWYFARNLLALWRDIASLADGAANASPAPESGAASAPDAAHTEALRTIAGYLGHAQEQVRLEALRVLTLEPLVSDAAISRALRDDSARVVSTAIDAILTRLGAAPATTLSREVARDVAFRLMALVDDPHTEESTRARAVRALATTPVPTVRGWLLQLVSHRSRLLGRIKLAPSRPTTEAALDLLAEQYAQETDVPRVLSLAGRAPASARSRRVGVSR